MARERVLARELAIFGIAVATCLVGGTALAEYRKLIRIIGSDPAYKVRMQAIRVLTKQIEKSRKPPSQEVINVLSRAAQADEEHLVRGIACFSLGKLGDPRAKAALKAALRDEDAFVRAQAEEALQNVQGRAPGGTKKKVLVIGTDEVPGVGTPPELSSALASLLEGGFSSRAGAAFAVGDRSGAGYHMKGSIAELSVVDEGGASRVTIVVKIAIATWPENNLRHVMSARASVRAKVASGPSLVRLQRKLLEAAVNKAIQDSMAQIGGG